MKDVIINDLHIPFHDKEVLLKVLKFIYDLQPTRLFLNGDFLDCYEISSFDKNPFELFTLREELKIAEGYLDQISSRLNKTKKIFIFGNHEYRFQKFLIRNAQPLMGLPGISLKEQLKLKELNYEIIDSGLKESFYDAGSFLVGHFNKVSIHSGYTAKALIERYGKSLIQAHVHRLGMHAKTLHGKTLIGIENGCLCDLNPSYTLSPNWQHGFTIIHYENNKPYFQIVPIVNKQFIF